MTMLYSYSLKSYAFHMTLQETILEASRLVMNSADSVMKLIFVLPKI